MKAILTEDRLHELISECIAEKLMESKMQNMVRKELIHRVNESKKEEDGRKSDEASETKQQSARRSQVESFFKGKGDLKQTTAINNAFFAYKLFGVQVKKGHDTLDMKNARSKFAKKLNHENNENGYPMTFSTSEITKLYSLITSNSQL